MRYYDEQMKTATKRDRNKMVPWYLMASYAYYGLDDPILTDKAFDDLALDLLCVWDIIKHQHKHLITEDDLAAGSLTTRDFPQIAKDAALDLIQRRNKK